MCVRLEYLAMSATKKISSRRPRGWTKCPKLRAAYEEGGESLGRLMLWEPERAKKAWKLISGTGIYPRWYLDGFRYHFVQDHPTEYRRWKKRRYEGRLRAKAKAVRLEESRRHGREAVDPKHNN